MDDEQTLADLEAERTLATARCLRRLPVDLHQPLLDDPVANADDLRSLLAAFDAAVVSRSAG